MTKKLICAIIGTLVMLMGISASAGVDHRITQEKFVTEVKPIDEGAAGIIFSDIPKKQMMDYVGGSEYLKTETYYSEQATFEGITGRQVYASNVFHIKLDRDFVSKEDNVIEFQFTYWDYNGAGGITIDYATSENGDYNTFVITKAGTGGGSNFVIGDWHTATVYVDDACFTGSFDEGADFRIKSGAFNTFARIQVRNLSREDMNGERDYGEFNARRAKVLNYLDVFDGYGPTPAPTAAPTPTPEPIELEDGQIVIDTTVPTPTPDPFDPKLDKVLTREEFMKLMITAYGLEEEALEKNITPKHSGVADEYKPYVGLCEELGVIETGEAFDAKSNFTQAEMFVYYLRLVGVDGATAKNSFALAKEHGLNPTLSMIFQPNKKVKVDNFVVPALAAFSMTNKKTGTSPFGIGFDSGKYNEQTLVEANDTTLSNWLTENEFTIEPTEIVDPYSGRTYYTLTFMGKSAMKEYYTENCMSMDCTRLYFRDSQMRLWEFTLATHKVKFMDYLAGDYNYMVSDQNNLWYLDKNWDIMKIDLDTYEKEFITDLPKWQTKRPSMLQVNSKETRISFEWFDTSGQFDANYRSRIPIYKVDEGEWDMNYSWGFDTNWYRPNHVCVNPVYDDYAFFAHEGNAPNGSGQTDRVWCVNMATNEYYNLIEQKYFRNPSRSNYMIGETLVHEAWSYDGEWCMAIANNGAIDGVARGVREKGLVMTDKEGKNKKYVPANYDFTWNNGGGTDGINHGMLSWDSKWLAGDSQYGRGWSDLYIISMDTAEATHLCRLTLVDNPGHIHPQFSPDDKMIIFGCHTPDKKAVQVGWIDVSDIVSKPPVGGHYDLSESCETFGFKGFETYLEPKYNEDGTLDGLVIPKGKTMQVCVKADTVEEDKVHAKINITYLDKGYQYIKLIYQIWNPDMGSIGRLTQHSKYIKCTGTGKLKTATIEIEDMNLGNMYDLGTDFKIHGTNSDVFIKSVDVEVVEILPELKWKLPSTLPEGADPSLKFPDVEV